MLRSLMCKLWKFGKKALLVEYLLIKIGNHLALGALLPQFWTTCFRAKKWGKRIDLNIYWISWVDTGCTIILVCLIYMTSFCNWNRISSSPPLSPLFPSPFVYTHPHTHTHKVWSSKKQEREQDLEIQNTSSSFCRNISSSPFRLPFSAVSRELD